MSFHFVKYGRLDPSDVAYSGRQKRFCATYSNQGAEKCLKFRVNKQMQEREKMCLHYMFIAFTVT